MATIKSFTSLEQSKKLAEILPLESADMVIWGKDLDAIGATDAQKLMKGLKDRKMNYIPCWSLSALLSVLPSATLDTSNDHYYRLHCMERYTEWHDNAIDTCYEMIVKLHELKLL